MWNRILTKLFWGVFRHFLSDEQYARVRYRLEFGRKLNLENPQRFSEKIQHLKLHERDEKRTIAADRTKVRNYVAEKVGEKYLIPLPGVYDELTPEVWDSLPDQFVLKANHGCGMIEIVRDKQLADFQKVHKKTHRWQQFDYYKFGREWPYKNVPRTILAEQLLLDESGDIPKDYKFFCFYGKMELFQIDFGRHEKMRRNLYDRQFNRIGANIIYDSYEGDVQKPESLDEMISVAENLSADFNFLRVDLYSLNNRIYFGELTNFPGNGFSKITPDAFDHFLGSKLKI